MPQLNCKLCSVKCGRYDDFLECRKCSYCYHTKCINMGATEFENIKKQPDMSWSCVNCIEDSLLSGNKTSSNTSTISPTLFDVMLQLQKILEVQNDLIVSVNSCHEQINECNNFLKCQEQRINECLIKIQDLETKNATLEKENIQLKQTLNDTEQYTRRNSLEIVGVPETRNENIISVVQAVGVALGFNLQRNMIDACHRVGVLSSLYNSRPIILKFVSRLDKEDFLNKRKIKRNLKVRDLNEDIAKLSKNPDNGIYINKLLTQHNCILFAKAKDYKKQHNIKYLWCKNGKIFMRKEDASKVYEIKTVNSFMDVH
ncbi:hypothetical protein RN001_005507 [Aquatica leii]|uniref:PHD-type domain-containing protein n=1 Tax=Aquatica leii TaxID=1421715 RepID=A0AAN7PCT1_9COLE|nr:hypothetical protein RN001_005507 [Aquatica leii]